MDIFFANSNQGVYFGWGWTLAGGIIDIFFGLILISLPFPVITSIFVFFIGFWIMFRSLWAIGTAFQHNGFMNSGWLLMIGILGLVSSFFYVISPIFGGVSLVILACISFIAYGFFRIFYAFKLKSINSEIEKKGS